MPAAVGFPGYGVGRGAGFGGFGFGWSWWWIIAFLIGFIAFFIIAAIVAVPGCFFF